MYMEIVRPVWVKALSASALAKASCGGRDFGLPSADVLATSTKDCFPRTA